MSTSSTEHAPGLFIRGFAPPLRLADFKLIAFDMDSTLINIECIDEIADAAGRKAEVAEITEAAMRGEIADYKDSLRRRVALLAGVPMDPKQAHFFDAKQWHEFMSFLPGWENAMPHIRHRVRSVSGWTKKMLGEPTSAWLNG